MRHLTVEQLEEMLAGRPKPGAAEHVQSCANCREELSSLGLTFSSLRGAATAVAAEQHAIARQAATGLPAGRPRFAIPRFAWGLAAAALVAGVSAPLALRHPAVKQPVAVQSVRPSLSDEALLSSVQEDLSSSVPDVLLPLSNTSSNATSSQTSREARTNE